MRREITSDLLTEWYDSTTDFVEQAQALRHALPDYFQRATTFNAHTSWNQVIELAIHGWPEGEKQARPIHENAIELVEQELPHPLFQAQWGLSGSEVDMGRYLSGVPECMIEFEPITVSKTGRVVTICVGMTYSSGISTQQIMSRGASVTALIMALEQLQHSVELWVDMSASSNSPRSNKRVSQKVLVKSAQDVLDPVHVAYWCSHPTVLRTLGFATEHDWPNEWQQALRVGTGYGSPPFTCVRNLPTGTIYLDGVELGQDPAQFVEKQLEELGLININEERG